MDFYANEQKDGIRFSWNVWPDSRLEAARMAVPIGCLYTPLKQSESLARVNYPPIRCKAQNCSAVLNPYCRVDFMNKIWVCPFCLTRNHFPHHYADISTENLPAEIIPQYTSIEYVVDPNSYGPPAFVFVVDTCILDEELNSLKASLQQSLMLLPENAIVGLITFGKNVHVHELNSEDCGKSFVFRGKKEIDFSRVAGMLGLNPQGPQQVTDPKQISRFLLPAAECSFQFESILEDLSPDEWPHPSDMRPERCTGVAMAVAVGLLEAAYKGRSARIVTFVGGPPTVGPGVVVDISLKEQLRSHYDLTKGNAPYFNKATKYYETLARRAQANGHVIDLFAACLDQVGVAEMKVCPEKTGGLLVLDDLFTSGVFVGSFPRVFNRENPADPKSDLAMAFGGTMQVLTSREFKVCGAIGAAGSLEQKTHSVAETEIGIGGTSAWSLGGLSPSSTVAVYFEVVNQNAQQLKDGRQVYLQFVTTYRHSSGRVHQRVTTVAKTFADMKENPQAQDQGLALVRAGFDQEAAAVLMARYAVWKAENEYAFDILRWLDRMLIRLTQKFAIYQKDNPDSLRLPQEFSYYPQFMFHLRRSQFLQVFNSSPDETAFFRLVLLRENTNNSLIMIQPTLMSYSLDGPAQPALLDVTSIASDRILLLDTFFNVVVFLGDTINKWVKDGVHLNPDYAYFADFLKVPVEDAQNLMNSRFPYPKYVYCEEHGSQSRFLMAKLNPSITHNNMDQAGGGEPPVFTDDVSLKVFLEHLRKLSVQA